MEFEKQFVSQVLHRALELDGPEVIPLTGQFEDINTPAQVLEQFNDITFVKGKNYIMLLVMSENSYKRN